MNFTKVFTFLLLALLITGTASAVVWNNDKLLYSNGQKKITINNGDDAVFSTGAFVSDADTVLMTVELLKKNDASFKKTISSKTVDVTQFTGFEKVTISQADYQNIGDYLIKVTLSDSFPDSQTDFLELSVQEKPTPTVVSFVISPKDKTVFIDNTVTYSATVTLSDGSTQDVTNAATWASTTVTVASMNKNVATAKNVGTTTIKASYQGKEATTSLTVKEKEIINTNLIKIELFPKNAKMFIGDTINYSAVGSYANGDLKDITSQVQWTSTDAAVASMNKNVATAKKAGLVLIKATLANVSGSTHLTVQEKPAPILLKIDLYPKNSTLHVGETQIYAAVATYSDNTAKDVTNTATWKSLDTTIASMNKNAATAKKSGETKIQALFENKIGETTLKVIAAPVPPEKNQAPTVTITQPNAGDTFQEDTLITFKATATDKEDGDLSNAIRWSYLNAYTNTGEEINTGKEMMKSFPIGDYIIIAAITDSQGISDTDSRYIKITKKQIIEPVSFLKKIIVSPQGATVYLEEGSSDIVSVTYTAMGVYLDGTTKDITQDVTWSKKDLQVFPDPAKPIVILQNNTAIAKHYGVSLISATLDTISGTTSLTVGEKIIDAILVEPKQATAKIGETINYKATAYYNEGTIIDITTTAVWTSTDAIVASMNKNVATAKNAGTTTINAQLGPKKGQAALLVTEPEQTNDPTVQILSPQEGKVYKTPVLLDIIGTNYNTITYTINNAAQKQYTGKEFLPFQEGVHKITAYALQGTKQATKSITFTIDTKAPLIIIEQPTDGETVPDNNVTIKVNVDDETDVLCTYTIVGKDTQENSITKTGTIAFTEKGSKTIQETLPNGSYTVTVTCGDEADNNADPVQVDFTVDDTDTKIPTISIQSPEAKTYTIQDILVSLLSSDAKATIEYTIDGGFKKTYTQAITEGFVEGSHVLVAYATNTAGTSTASIIFIVKTTTDNTTNSTTDIINDTSAPTITIITPTPNEKIWKNPVAFIFNTADDVEVVNCKLLLNGKVVETIPVHQKSAQITTSKLLGEGVYTLAVECTDATNKTTKTVDFTFTVTQPPTTPAPFDTPEQGIFVKKILFDSAQTGDNAKFTLVFKNIGVDTLENTKVKVSILDLGISKTIGPFDLKADDEMSKKVFLEIPEDAQPGDYTVRFVWYGEGITRIKHKEITII